MVAAATSRRVDRAMLATSMAIAAVLVFHFRHFVHDDAYITLRYVARLLSGHGLTWTDGERVEGFTHPLWLAQIAALGALGIPLDGAARGLGVVYLGGLLVLWWRSRAWTPTALLIATQPGLLLWSVGGLETVSACFWLALATWSTIRLREPPYATAPSRGRAKSRAPETPPAPRTRDAILTGLAWAAAALTRPEMLACALVACAWLMWKARDVVIPMVGAMAAPLVFYLAFRLTYFGGLLPATAHTKIAGLGWLADTRSALRYLSREAWLWLPGFAVAVVVTVLARRLGATRVALAIAAIGAPVLIAILIAGGDHMPCARFLLPLFVLAALSAALTGGRLAGAVHHIALGLVLGASAWQLVAALRLPAEPDAAAVIGRMVGRYLQPRLPRGTLVAIATAGSTPYFAPSLRFIDTLGLNDRTISNRAIDHFTTRLQASPGHHKGDGAYVLSRAPDVVVLGPAEGYSGDDPDAWFLTEHELLISPEFHRRYRRYRFYIPVTIEEAGASSRVRFLLDRSRRALPFTAWLRDGSPAALALGQAGEPMAHARADH